jgi:hypothetical protein
MDSDQVDAFTRRTLRGLGELSTPQRVAVLEGILRADPQLAPVLPELLATCMRARMRYVRNRGPLIRDGVS